MRVALAVRGAIAVVALGCAQSHPTRCPTLDEAMAADAMVRARACARAAACHRDGGGDLSSQCFPTWGAAGLCDALANEDVVFHPENVAACVTALDACEAMPCVERISQPVSPFPTRRCVLDACDDLFEWPLGPRCDDGVCPAEETCAFTDETCGGTCMPRGVAGAACSRALPCGDRLRCADGACTGACDDTIDCIALEHVDEASVCDGGQCRWFPLPHVGEPCVMAYDTWECAYDDGSYCNAATHVCTAQAMGGEPCDPAGGSRACRYPWTCDASGVCVGTGSCTPFGGCSPQTPYCMPGERSCTADATMQECDVVLVSWAGYETCPDGFACFAPDVEASPRGTCVPVVPIGASCDDSVACETGTSCDGGRCLRVAALGAACDASVSCGPDYACVAGRCDDDPNRYRSIGDTCAADAECASGRCLVGLCAWRDVGTPCVTVADLTFGCEFGCEADGLGGAVCRAGVDQLPVNAPCDDTHFCQDALVCLPRAADGVAMCRPRC